MLSLNYQLDEQRSRRRQRRNNRDSLEARASRVMNKSFLRLLLNTKSLNNMLSKDKEFFTNLNRMTGVLFDNENGIQPYQNIPECFMTCTGTIEGLTGSLAVIMKYLPRKFDSIPPGSYSAQVIFPYDASGKLFGNGGENIRKLNEETNTTIRVANVLEINANKRNRTAIVFGKEQDVLNCLQVLEKEIDGYVLEKYPGSVSIRVAVPVQAIYYLFPPTATSRRHPDLESFTNVKIRQAPIEDSIAGFTQSGVDISGPSSVVLQVTQVIQKLVSQWLQERKIDISAVTMKFVINREIAGVVIGKKGANLKKIQQDYNVHVIPISSNCYSLNKPEMVFYFIGTPTAIVDAITFVLNQMNTNSLQKRLPVDYHVYLPPTEESASVTSNDIPIGEPPQRRFKQPYKPVVSTLNPHAQVYQTKSELFPESLDDLKIQPPTVHFSIMDYQPGKRITISIPYDCSGKVIGRKGASVNYIKKYSHCIVSIDNTTELNEQRIITISGDSADIKLALCRNLIYIFINHNSDEIVMLIRLPYYMNSELMLCVKDYRSYTKKILSTYESEHGLVLNEEESEEGEYEYERSPQEEIQDVQVTNE